MQRHLRSEGSRGPDAPHSRAAHGAVGLLLVGIAVAALGRAPGPEPRAAPSRERRALQAPPAPAAARLREGRAIDLNQARPGDLELLPGIGPRLAQRIAEHRARVGRFTRVEDLTQVRGIGVRTLERLRPLVCAEHCEADAHHRSKTNTPETTAAR